MRFTVSSFFSVLIGIFGVGRSVHISNVTTMTFLKIKTPIKQKIMKSNASTVSFIVPALLCIQTERELILLIFRHEGLCSPTHPILSN